MYSDGWDLIVWLAMLGLVVLVVLLIAAPFAAYWVWNHVQVVIR